MWSQFEIVYPQGDTFIMRLMCQQIFRPILNFYSQNGPKSQISNTALNREEGKSHITLKDR